MTNYIGIDFGDKKEAIITVLSKIKGKLEIKKRIKTKNIDLNKLTDEIENIIKVNKAKSVVCDYGYNPYIIQKLQNKFGNKVKSCYYQATKGRNERYDPDTFMIFLNRDENMSEALRVVGYPFSCKFPPATSDEMHSLNYAYAATKYDRE